MDDFLVVERELRELNRKKRKLAIKLAKECQKECDYYVRSFETLYAGMCNARKPEGADLLWEEQKKEWLCVRYAEMLQKCCEDQVLVWIDYRNKYNSQVEVLVNECSV